MKKRRLLITWPLLWLLVLALPVTISCSSDDDTYTYITTENYSVSIALETDPTANKAVVTFTPDAGVLKVVYALGTEANRASFVAGTYINIKTHEGDAAFTETFTDLTPETEYTLFAVAYNADNEMQAVASQAFITLNDGVLVEKEYASDISAGFRVTVKNNYYGVKYALGTANDRAAFLNGTLSGITEVKEFNDHVANYFDLQPETEYVFYCRGYDRFNNPTIVFEEAITTTSSVGIPDVTFSYVNNVLTGTYSIEANENCGKVIAYGYANGMYDGTYFGTAGFGGDIFLVLERWVNNTTITSPAQEAVAGGTIELSPVTYDLGNSIPVDVYVAIYDKDMNKFGVKKFSAVTPAYDATAGEAAVEITFTAPVQSESSIYYFKSDYTFTPNANTFGYFYETVAVSWYNEAMAKIASGEYDPYYIHEYLYTQSYYTSLVYYFRFDETETFSYTEEYLYWGDEYMVVAAPMNKNGRAGWGPLCVTGSFLAQ